MFTDFICDLSKRINFMNSEIVIFFSTKHPVDHYILKWQPPFVLVRGQSISILAKPVSRLEYRIIAYDATGSQYQILRNN